MIEPKVAFIVYGVHKDGLQDPMGAPFIDDEIINSSKQVLSDAGLSVELVCKPGEGVLARLGRNNGEFEMLITHCSVFEPTAEQLEIRRKECGIPFWPHAFVTAHCDIERLIEVWSSEYAVLGYGTQLYEDLKAFCELTGIKVIAL